MHTRLPSASTTVGIALALCVVVSSQIPVAAQIPPKPQVQRSFFVERCADLEAPQDLAFHDGGLYVGNGDNFGKVRRVQCDSFAVEQYGDSIEDPDAVIVDVNGVVGDPGVPGAVLVAGNPRTVSRIRPDQYQTTEVVFHRHPWLDGPQQMAFNSQNHLFIANCRVAGRGFVTRVDGTTLQPFFWLPEEEPCAIGLAVARDGREAFVAGRKTGKVWRFDSLATGSPPIPVNVDIFPPVRGPASLAVDPGCSFGGLLYVVDRGNRRVLAVNPDKETGNALALVWELGDPTGITFGDDGALYVSDWWGRLGSNSGTIWRIRPAIEFP